MQNQTPGKDGRTLSVKHSGVGRLTLKDDGTLDPSLETMIACWETPIRNQPSRCTVRCDGYIQRWNNNDGDEQGFPCAVLRIDYSIGGFQLGGSSGEATPTLAPAMRSLYVDAVNQSIVSLVATTIEVVPVWDQRRIARLTAFYEGLSEGAFSGPAKQQILAAAIDANDYGPADARWLDVVAWSNEESTGVSTHPIPPGARACRVLNATSTAGAVVLASSQLSAIQWAAYPDPTITTKYIHQDCIPDCNCILDVPAGASYLFLRWAQDDEVNLGGPFWVEWLISPKSL